MLLSPSKEVDVDFLVFVERYASDLLKLDVLTFFANQPNTTITVTRLSEQIGHNVQLVRQEVGDFALLGLLQQVGEVDTGPLYRLTEVNSLRREVLKLAAQ